MAQENKTLLMGHGSNHMNLALVRNRAEEVRRSVMEVQEALASGATLRWEDFLKKFSIINQQVMAMREQLRGLLKSVVVHPKLVDNPGVAHALPIQLASKLTPEMEARDAELVSNLETSITGGADPSAKGQAAESARYLEITGQMDAFNRFVTSLTSSGGPLDSKGVGYKEMEKTSRAIAALAADAKALAVAGLGQGQAPRTGGIGASAALGRAVEAPPRVGQQAAKRARTGGAGAGGAGGPGAAAGEGGPQAMDPALMALFGEGLRPGPRV